MYLPNEHWIAILREDYPVYSPVLIVEILSPSNGAANLNRQRLAAFSGGTDEFAIVDPDSETIEVSFSKLETKVF